MSTAPTERVAVLAPRSAIAGNLVEQLTARGARVAGIGRDLDGWDAPERSAAVVCDLTDFDAVDGALQEAGEALDGGLTGIVNCAGSMLLKPAHLTSRAEFDDTIAANLTTAFAVVRAARSAFEGRGGAVVLLSSAAATLGMGNHEVIAAAKAGVEGLARSAAATYAASGIRFNVVAPGLVETPLSRAITDTPAARKVSEQLHPVGRIGLPGDIARAVCWLLSPEQDWVTGQVLGVDGGLGRVQPRPRVRGGIS